MRDGEIVRVSGIEGATADALVFATDAETLAKAVGVCVRERFWLARKLRVDGG